MLLVTSAVGFAPRVTSIRSSRQGENCAVFFPGGSAFIHHDIYRSFLSKLVSEGTDVYIPPFQYADTAALVSELRERYENVAAVAHSSGATVALNKCGGSDVKFVLLDPVNTRIGNLSQPFHISDNTPAVLFLHAMKSFQMNQNPAGLPFIPFRSLRIRPASLPPTTVVRTIDSAEHGHSDILDHLFADFMHNSRISVGTLHRDTLEEYHLWLAKTIHTFISEES